MRHIHVRATSLWSNSDVSRGHSGISILHHVVERTCLGAPCLPVYNFSRESNDNESSKQNYK